MRVYGGFCFACSFPVNSLLRRRNSRFFGQKCWFSRTSREKLPVLLPVVPGKQGKSGLAKASGRAGKIPCSLPFRSNSLHCDGVEPDCRPWSVPPQHSRRGGISHCMARAGSRNQRSHHSGAGDKSILRGRQLGFLGEMRVDVFKSQSGFGRRAVAIAGSGLPRNVSLRQSELFPLRESKCATSVPGRSRTRAVRW